MCVESVGREGTQGIGGERAGRASGTSWIGALTLKYKRRTERASGEELLAFGECCWRRLSWLDSAKGGMVLRWSLLDGGLWRGYAGEQSKYPEVELW